MRLMVMPVGRRPGFFRITGKKYFVLYRSQVKNISYPTDHRQNLFWFFPDHRQKTFRTLPSTGKNYFVLYRSQAKTISYSTDHRQKIFRTLPKRYFGLYLLVGGRKPYPIWNPIYCKDSWRDYPLP